jgi:hypothetical protein
LSSPDAKISAFRKSETVVPSARPASTQGAYASSRTRGGMQWTRVASQDERHQRADGQGVWSWRPDAGVKSAIRSAGDGGKRARSPGEHVIGVKTIAQGRPDQFGEPAVTNSCAFYFRTRGCGCIGHPAFPAPSVYRGTVFWQSSGVSRRENAELCLMDTSAPRSAPSSPAKAGDPVFQRR